MLFAVRIHIIKITDQHQNRTRARNSPKSHQDLREGFVFFVNAVEKFLMELKFGILVFLCLIIQEEAGAVALNCRNSV